LFIYVINLPTLISLSPENLTPLPAKPPNTFNPFTPYPIGPNHLNP
jgi:hypothetical protein